MKNLLTLFIVLLVLKISGYLNIAWWIVTMPLWIVPAFFVGLIPLTLIILLFFAAMGLIIVGGIMVFEFFERRFKK